MTAHQSSANLSRRHALAGLTASGAGLVLAAATHPVAAQEASPAPMATNPIVGTWVLTFVEPPMPPVVAVFHADGTFVDAGVWEPNGPNTVLHTWVHVFPPANNYVVVSGNIEVDPSGESWTEDYSLMVVGADGTVLNTGGGSVHGARLHPVPPDQLNAPLDVVPTWTPAPATPTS